MGKSEHCTYCIEFYRSSISRTWGTSNRVVEIPGCTKCHTRHENEVSQLKAAFERQKEDHETELSNSVQDCRTRHEKEVSKLKADLDKQKEYYETELSNSVQALIIQETSYEESVSVLRLNSSIDVNQLNADNKEQRSKVKFLQVFRDFSEPDVVLEVPGLQISAHRAILAARSPVFRQMVYTGIVENPPSVIKVEDISSPVLEAIVDFCYSGEFTFTELVPPDEVLKVAHTFGLARLKELCDIQLCRIVTVDNVPQMLKLSRRFSAIKLEAVSGKVFKDHFDMLKDKVYGALES